MSFNKQHGTLFKAMLKHSLVLLFSFFFLWGQASGIVNFEVNTSDQTSLAQIASINHSHTPLDLPYEAPAVPATEENENLDNDDDLSDNYYFAEHSYGLIIISSDDVTIYSDKSIKGKTGLPLFILYHCWKSFLV